jgi:hypothetical protein
MERDNNGVGGVLSSLRTIKKKLLISSVSGASRVKYRSVIQFALQRFRESLIRVHPKSPGKRIPKNEDTAFLRAHFIRCLRSAESSGI